MWPTCFDEKAPSQPSFTLLSFLVTDEKRSNRTKGGYGALGDFPRKTRENELGSSDLEVESKRLERIYNKEIALDHLKI